MRRVLVPILMAAALLTLPVGVGAPPGPGVGSMASLEAGPPAAQAQVPEHVTRALRAYTALQSAWDVWEILRTPWPEPPGGERLYPFLWPLSQVLGGTMALRALPEAGDRARVDVELPRQALEWYWDERMPPPGYASYPPPPLGRGGDLYYDDNAWTGVMLMQHTRQTGDPTSLSRARQIFDLLVSGWDSDPTHPAPGGIPWVRADWSRQRNTVSTAPAALLGLQLYQLTREAYYLDWALRMYAWVEQHLRAPNGLYWDHVEPDGTVEAVAWSYNQGSMIGASLLLYRLNGNPAYLASAVRTADAAVREWSGGELRAQPPAFNALFARYLLQLWAETGTPAYRQLIEEYADELWETVRNPVTDVFSFERRDVEPLLDQAAMVQLYAYLAWDPLLLRQLV